MKTVRQSRHCKYCVLHIVIQQYKIHKNFMYRLFPLVRNKFATASKEDSWGSFEYNEVSGNKKKKKKKK